ncbi:MAG: hypothetical protein EA376_04820 [Phycisphaeraceae bacterium]|nr:MAG: hypothetical protein EA376_04820 [Phycisphaeraceae bacterium]
MQIDGPSNPFHIARAYGVRQIQPLQPMQRPDAASSVRDSIPVRQTEQPTGVNRAETPPNIQRLVGAVVPGGIDFTAPEPRPTEASLPMYRHPADRNAAATALALGRSLDIAG